MGRLSDQDRERNEASIRAAMDRLLRGQIPPGGKCDIKTLAAASGVTRTGFYPKGDRRGPYQHLAEEFERALTHCHATGDTPDPRDAQIARLKDENTTLRERLAAAHSTVAEISAFKALAISRLATQHDEIQRLRTGQAKIANVRDLRPAGPGATVKPC
jgi:hypothetical protein